MWDWITRNWRDQWLGNFSWWQAFAAVVQASFAILIYYVTRRYVAITRQLMLANVEPVIELRIPDSEQGYSASGSAIVMNTGAIEILNLKTSARLYASKRGAYGYNALTGKGAFVTANHGTLQPNNTVEFSFHSCLDAAAASRHEREAAEPGGPFAYRIVIEAVYQRPCDLRVYRSTMRRDVKWNSSGEQFTIASDLIGLE